MKGELAKRCQPNATIVSKTEMKETKPNRLRDSKLTNVIYNLQRFDQTDDMHPGGAYGLAMAS